MQCLLSSQRHSNLLHFQGPKIITTYETAPRLSLLGGIVEHYYLKGVHVRACVVSCDQLGNKGLKVDSQWGRNEYERKVITAAILKRWQN